MTLVYEFPPIDTPVRRRDEPPIVVRASRDVVAVEVHPGQLDAPATAALASTITAAVETGAVVLITFGNPELSEEPLRSTADHTHRAAEPAARVAGPGFIHLAAGDRPWLLDVVARRISTVPADRRFLPPEAWTPVRTVTITAASVAATTASGELIVTYHPR